MRNLPLPNFRDSTHRNCDSQGPLDPKELVPKEGRYLFLCTHRCASWHHMHPEYHCIHLAFIAANAHALNESPEEA
ncbi:hypothetical protein NDU88_004485 [Pleurodeles waltl]|uniref:SWIM-type domain-containing protein n=1 Tax=Pleurodeles waltl TaxID=8319 RepID=A0AAV7M8C2_PLEWA|nr:hypothetical protein NDU88_004485 [Pleurodeles waltl]